MANRDDRQAAAHGNRRRTSNRLWQTLSRLFVIVLATIGILNQDAEAAGLRCGHDLVQEGDSYLDLTDACGDPDREVALVGEDNQQVGTALYYEGGYGKADRKVYLRGGTVTGIERLD